MANLTITVDDATLRRARMRALERHESVNSYLAEVLRRYADASESPMEDVIALARASEAGTAGRRRRWTRDELHRG
jgi:plasmid stability protein